MFFSSKAILLLLMMVAMDTFISSQPIGEGNGNADKAVKKKSYSTGRVGTVAKGVITGALLATAGSLAQVADARPLVQTNHFIATPLVPPPPSARMTPPVQESAMRRRANVVRKDGVQDPNASPTGFKVAPLPPGGFNPNASCGKNSDGTPMGPCIYAPPGTTGLPDEYKVNEDEDKGWCC